MSDEAKTRTQSHADSRTPTRAPARKGPGRGLLGRLLGGRGARERGPMTVFVTGGSQGIGLAVARAYALEGARVGIFARNAERLLAARAELEALARPDARVGAYAMDVTDEGDVVAMTTRAVAELGAPDVLVCNAGIIAGDRFERIPSAEFEAVIRTNLFGVANTIRALLPSLKERRGRIVNVASMAGLVGMYGYTAYASSKYALVGFSESLRAELRPDGVSVTVVCPPEVPTAMVAEEDRTLPRPAKLVKRMAGVVSPEAVARAAVAGAARRQFLVIPGLQAQAVRIVHALSFGHLSRLTADAVFALADPRE